MGVDSDCRGSTLPFPGVLRNPLRTSGTRYEGGNSVGQRVNRKHGRAAKRREESFGKTAIVQEHQRLFAPHGDLHARIGFVQAETAVAHDEPSAAPPTLVGMQADWSIDVSVVDGPMVAV
jgi:hypothetical protein